MKNITYLFSVLFTSVMLCVGCAEEGVYAPPVVGELIAHPGKYRAKVEFQAPTESMSGKIFYGNGNFKEFTIDKTKDTQTIIVEKLPEGEVTLRVVTLNNKGETSDPKGVKVSIYGDNYQKKLINRKLLNQRTISPTSIEMFFDNGNPDETGVRVLFTNLSGVKDSVMMSGDNKSIVIENINLSETYYFYTVYKPTTNFIDEFAASKIDAKEAAMKNFEKEIWTIAAVSDEEPARVASNIIDNKAGTVWHSQNESMPHWVIVDMQSEKKFDGFYFVQAQEPGDTGYAGRFKFEVSSDNENWTVISEGRLKANSHKQTFKFQESVVSRYFKISILDNYNGITSAQIAEVDLFNDSNVSGTNGVNLPVLENAKQPFQGDGSDLFPPVGAGRFQRLTKWTHSSNAYISFDSNMGTFSVWSAAVWGISLVTNGKIYQTLDILPGRYVLNIDAAHTTSPYCVDMYGVIANGTAMPDYNRVTSASEVLGFSDLVANQKSINTIPFTIEKATSITIGVVYNTHDIFGATGIPWSDMNINGFELLMR